MTLSEFIEQNKDKYKVYGENLKRAWNNKLAHAHIVAADAGKEVTDQDRNEIAQDMEDEISDNAGDLTSEVLDDWKGSLPADPEGWYGVDREVLKANPLTPDHAEAIAKLLPMNPRHTIRHIYLQMLRKLQSTNIKYNVPFVRGLLENGLKPTGDMLDDMQKEPEMAPLLDFALSLPDKSHGKVQALSNLVRNPAIKPQRLMELVHSMVQEPKRLVDYSDMLNSIKGRVGKTAIDAELDKLPSTHPIFYIPDMASLGIASLSGRSGQEIQDHIDQYRRLSELGKKPKNTPEEYDELKAFAEATGNSDNFEHNRINKTVMSNPNFSVANLRSFPDGYFELVDMMPKEFPSLKGSMSEEEARDLFVHLGEPVYRGYNHSLSPKFTPMVDFSLNGGRPIDENDVGDAFTHLSNNPTFKADVQDIRHLHSEGHFILSPEQMTPNLQGYFQDLKPLYEKTFENPWNMETNPEIQGALSSIKEHYGENFPEPLLRTQNPTQHLANLLPVMSHVDPHFVGRLMDKSHQDIFQVLGYNLRNNSMVNLINPEAFNGMTNSTNMFEVIRHLGLPTKGLNDSAMRLMKEGFLGYLPNVEQKFAHFPDGGWSYDRKDLDRAADYGALGEFFKHVGSGVKHRTLQVKRGSGTLRALRDYLEQAKERGVHSINPRDLPKDKTWNSVYQSLVTKNKDGSTTESKAIDWNPLRGKDGNVSAETVQAHIDRMQPIGVHVTETKWDGAQRHNDKSSNVVVFGMTDDHIAKLKAAGVWDDFQKVSDDLPRGHPQHPYALGWVRYTTGDATKKSHVFIDEVQNDVAKVLGGNGDISDANKKKIMDILYDGSHPSDMLHEAFHEYARSKKWHGRPFTIHSPESKKPISLQRQDQPVPVHYKKTYEEILKQRFHVEPSTYGERKGETHEDIQGKPVWTGTIRKTEEELEKMALADVKPFFVDYTHYNYSNLLPEHLKREFDIRVNYHPPAPEYGNRPRIIAQAISKKREFVGSITGFINGDKLETHQGMKPRYQQRGIGSALLESVLAHAYNFHGIRGVDPAEHTEGATGTHRRVSGKHDLGFESSPTTRQDKHGQWYEHGGYTLKSEGYSDWE